MPNSADMSIIGRDPSTYPLSTLTPKFRCPETGKPLSKPFSEMTTGEYYDETGIDLLFRVAIGVAGPLIRRGDG